MRSRNALTEHSYYSFEANGLLKRLEASNKYKLPYELEKEYHDELQQSIRALQKKHKQKLKETLEKGLKKGKAEGLQESAEQIARQMLSKGLDIQLITEMTGLSPERLEGLKAD